MRKGALDWMAATPASAYQAQTVSQSADDKPMLSTLLLLLLLLKMMIRQASEAIAKNSRKRQKERVVIARKGARWS